MPCCQQHFSPSLHPSPSHSPLTHHIPPPGPPGAHKVFSVGQQREIPRLISAGLAPPLSFSFHFLLIGAQQHLG